MDLESRLDVLGGAANVEVAGMAAGRSLRRGYKARWVYHAAAPAGRRVRLMSLLMTNACSLSCTYCATRRDRNVVRAAVGPDELARTFDQLVRADLADGMFLTSGIPGRPQAMMDRMLAAVELIRHKYRFRGYVHLKVLPGADAAQVERAARLASRLSINLEAPREEGLREVAPEKSLANQILPVLAQVARMRAESDPGEGAVLPAGVTTQLIPGVGKESDQQLLQLSTKLLRRGEITKTHFSAFQPVIDTPLENRPAASPARERRLYQADYLLRTYGFDVEELRFDERGQLSPFHDPKLAWALANPGYYPVEILRAEREQLLRVPGIGPLSAGRILASRRLQRIRTLADLQQLGVVTKRARRFITLAGKAFEAAQTHYQASLEFEPDVPRHEPLACANGISPCAFR